MLKESLLFSIFKFKYKDITLEKYFRFENRFIGPSKARTARFNFKVIIAFFY
jgi:hypothetical protein